MAIYLIIALALTVPTVLATTTPTPDTVPQSSSKIDCAIPANTKDINDTLEIAEKCFRKLVFTKIGDSTKNIDIEKCDSVEQFDVLLQKFLESTTKCANEEDRHTERTENVNKFVNVVNRTLSDNHYKEFYENNGLSCVQEERNNIEDCVRVKTNRHDIELHPNLHLRGFVSLQIKQGCEDNGRIKDCVEKVLQNNMQTKKNCTQQNVKFVNFLYNVTAEEFCSSLDLQVSQEQSQGNANANAFKSDSSSSAPKSSTTIRNILTITAIIVMLNIIFNYNTNMIIYY